MKQRDEKMEHRDEKMELSMTNLKVELKEQFNSHNDLITLKNSLAVLQERQASTSLSTISLKKVCFSSLDMSLSMPLMFVCCSSPPLSTRVSLASIYFVSTLWTKWSAGNDATQQRLLRDVANTATCSAAHGKTRKKVVSIQNKKKGREHKKVRQHPYRVI